MSAAARRDRPPVTANLTPMIDVTFLLIIFFVLVSQIVEVENVDLEPPRPREAATELPGEEQRVVINVLPAPDGGARGYRMRRRTYAADSGGLDSLSAALSELYRADPNLNVNLRADRRTHYRWVEPVFDAVSGAAQASGRPVRGRINLVVVKEP